MAKSIEDLYQQYAGRAPDPEGLAYWSKFGDTIDANEINIFQTAVAEARAQGTEPAAQPAPTAAQIANTPGMGSQGIGLNLSGPMFSGQTLAPDYAALMRQPSAAPAQAAPLYEGLTASSTPAQIAAAYAQFTSGAGGDTAANQNAARTFLESRGITAPTIDQAYAQYIQPSATPNYEQMVRDAYASIGRTGIGTEASNIDQAGFTNWVNALQSGSVNPADLTNTFKNSVAEYLIANPTDRYSTYVTDFLQQSNAPEIAEIQKLYKDVLGREADPSGLGTWYQKFGAQVSDEERAEFEQAAMAEKYGSVPDSLYSVYKSIYGVEPDAGTLAQLNNRFGPTFDADEIRELVVNDFSLRDDPRGVVKTLQQQILDQGTTKYWSGEAFGSAEKTAADMARMLATAGITDINQFGKITVAADAAVTPVYGTRKAFDPEYGEYEQQYITGYTDANGKAVDPSLVRAEFDENGTGAYIAPVGTKEVFGNKETGVALDPRYDRAQGNIFSGTFAGKGSTGYGVQFKDDGTPVFYTQYGGSTNTVKQIMDDLGPVGQIALAVATGGLSIPQQIAAQAALQLASGADIKDIAKNVAVSFVMSKIPGSELIKDGAKYLNSIDTSGVLSSAFKSAATSGTRAALTGKDIGDAILSGAIGGGTAGAIDLMAEGVEDFGKLTKSEQNMVKNAISGVVSGRPLDQVLINAAISAGREAVRTAPKSSGKIAGLDDDGLPTGVQVASADGSLPLRTEVTGAPVFADSRNAASVRPPAGYTLAATTDPAINEPARYDDNDRLLPKSDGTYYDVTQNAWFKPTGAFDAALNVPDYSPLFDKDRATLTDADVAAIRGGGSGAPSSGFDLDLGEIFRTPSGGGSGIPNLGELVMTAPRPPADDMGEMVITAPRDPVADMGEMVITAPREPVPDLGEIVVTAPREPLPIEPLPEEEIPDVVIPNKPAATTPKTTPTATTPSATEPRVTPKKVAQMLGVPVSSQIVQDVIEALYGTMEYLDVSEEFKPSERKAKPAATQKQLQQTKMAQGGYLDDLLAENMSADDLLKLLR